MCFFFDRQKRRLQKYFSLLTPEHPPIKNLAVRVVASVDPTLVKNTKLKINPAPHTTLEDIAFSAFLNRCGVLSACKSQHVATAFDRVYFSSLFKLTAFALSISETDARKYLLNRFSLYDDQYMSSGLDISSLVRLYECFSANAIVSRSYGFYDDVPSFPLLDPFYSSAIRQAATESFSRFITFNADSVEEVQTYLRKLSF